MSKNFLKAKNILFFMVAICLLLLMTMNSYAAGAETTFSDVPKNHWGYSYIEDMVKRGVLNGYNDGTFRPDNYVTRAEAAKMIAKIGGKYENDPYESFIDVPANEWYGPYVYAVDNYFNDYKVKVNGSSEYAFYPDSYAEREDIIVALVRQGYYSTASDIKLSKEYSDFEAITEEKRKHIETAVRDKIVSGYSDGTIRPHEPVTRAEMATLLCRMYGSGYLTEPGYSIYSLNCTVDEFISRYNSALESNFSKVKGSDEILLGAQRYMISKDMFTTVSYPEMAELGIDVSRGNNHGFFCDKNGKVVSVNFICSGQYYVIDRNLCVVFPIEKYQAVCTIMAALNMPFDEAVDLLTKASFNKNFSIDKNYVINAEKSSVSIKSFDFYLKTTYFNAKDGFGIQSENAEDSNIKPLDCKINRMIENYNNAIYDNFKELTVDARYIAPEDFIIHVDSLFAESSKESLNVNQEDLSVSPELQGKANDLIKLQNGSWKYRVNNTNFRIQCDSENNVIKVNFTKPESINKKISGLDQNNLQHISMIMALNNLSFDEAKNYYFAAVEDGQLTIGNTVYTFSSSPGYTSIFSIESLDYYTASKEM